MKYLFNGQAVEFVSELPDGRGFVVDQFVEDEQTGEPVVSGMMHIVEKVFDKPPIGYIDKMVREAEEKLAEVLGRLESAKKNLRETVSQRKQLFDKLEQVPALRRLEDFIDGKITHVVSRQYGHIHIMPIGEVICDSDREYRRNPKRLKLMTLYGEQPGNLSFRINKYKDGSGSDASEYEAFPCCSEEEAKQQAGLLIEEQLAEEKGYYREEAVKAADKIGHPVADSIRESVRMKQVEKKRKEVEEARQRLESAEKNLETLVSPAAKVPAT